MFLTITLWIVGILLGLFLLAAFLNQPLRRWVYQREERQAREQFRQQRETLEAKFFDMARQLGKPRDLVWVDCDWQQTVTFARDAQTGLLTAFAAVNVSFEAVEGGDMEEVEADTGGMDHRLTMIGDLADFAREFRDCSIGEKIENVWTQIETESE